MTHSFPKFKRRSPCPARHRPVALITGASSGIGKATVELFAANGFIAVGGQRTVSDSCHDLNRIQLDVTKNETIERAVKAIIDQHGRIDVLVNNAGYALLGPLESLSQEQLERQFATNILGLMAVTRAVVPILRNQRGGVIVNISSIAGRMAFPFGSAYHATKWAVEGFSESLRFELAPFGIRVKIVEPGSVQTGFRTRNLDLSVTPPYEALSRPVFETFHKEDCRLPGPDGVARTILRAVKDPTERLRFPVYHRPYLPLYQLLPDRIWRALMRSVLGKIEA